MVWEYVWQRIRVSAKSFHFFINKLNKKCEKDYPDGYGSTWIYPNAIRRMDRQQSRLEERRRSQKTFSVWVLTVL